MRHDPRKYLSDMQDSARFLLEFTQGRSRDEYKRDRGFRSAVERELQIIGEALLALEKGAPEVAGRITDHHRIIRFRHILVHGYDVLDHEVVWTVVRDKLPLLFREVEELLRDFPQGGGEI